MRYFSPEFLRPRSGTGVSSGTLRPANMTGLPFGAEAQFFILTRTHMARAFLAAPQSLFERAGRVVIAMALCAWRQLNDNAYVNRRAPPGRNPGSRS
jgi:hypothetical protein